MTELRLGRKPGVVHDRRTIKAADYLDVERLLPEAPKRVNHSHGLTFEMLANDTLGDCCFAAKTHLRHGVARKGDEPAGEAVANAYLEFTGGQDTGCYELDVLNDWRRRDAGDGAATIEAYAAIDLKDRNLVKTAVWLFGGIYMGCSLPLAAEQQLRQGLTWKPVTGSDGKPGSWGGHAMYLADTAPETVTFVTWGRLQRATWDWWTEYVDEAYVVIHPDWLARRHGKTPQGFNEQQLLDDVKALTG